MKIALRRYGVKLKGKWDIRDVRAAYSAVEDISNKMGGITGFQSEFNTNNTPLILLWGNSSSEYYISSECQGITSGACNTGLTQDIHGNPVTLINFMSMSSYYHGTRRNNVVHEIGHLFNVLHGGDPASFAGNYAGDRDKILRPFSNGAMWQLNTYYNPEDPGRTNSEMFADMFVAWVYDSWNTNPKYADVASDASSDMNVNMAEWLSR